MEGALDPGVSLALLGTIVLDTINMDKLANRGTPRDQYVIDQLLYHTNWSSNLLPQIKDFYSTTSNNTISSTSTSNTTSSPSNNNTAAVLSLQRIFDFLNNAKFDSTFWNEMSLTDCLRMDYKEFQSNTTTANNKSSSFGISSILIPLSQLERKDGFLEEMNTFMKLRNIELLAVMSLTFPEVAKKNPKRELMIIARNQQLSDTMIAALLDHSHMLQLTEIINNNDGNSSQYTDGLVIRKFLQGNVRVSRKGIAPIMLQCKI